MGRSAAMPGGWIGSGSCCRTSSNAGRCSSSGGVRGLHRLTIEIEDPVDLRIPRVEALDLAAAGLAHSAPEIGVACKALHCVRQPRNQALAGLRGDEDTAGLVDIFGGTAPFRRDHR